MDDMRNTSAPLYGKAEPATTKTTMSVRKMRQLLGLGKTDSYWLLHKNLFEVILINDKRRIVISSFEKWYANQVKYHKVNGSPPGEELCKRSYSVPDTAEILKVKPETIYTLIRQGKLKTETTDFCLPACSGKDTRSSGESISPPGRRIRSGLPGSKLWASITRKKPLPSESPEAPSPPGSPSSAMGRSACSLIFRTISRPSKAPDANGGRPSRI